MSFDSNSKRAVDVDVFPVKVLGGTFHVREVLLFEDQMEAEVIATIHDIPADRWFVMVSDDHRAEQDALAMIDDQLEFQIFAHGVLRQD